MTDFRFHHVHFVLVSFEQLLYVYPFSPASLGFDAYCDPTRRATIDKAMETGLPTLTPRLLTSSSAPTAALYFPLYNNTFVSPDRTSDIDMIGILSVQFLYEDLVRSAVQGQELNLTDVLLFDNTNASNIVVSLCSLLSYLSIYRSIYLSIIDPPISIHMSIHLSVCILLFLRPCSYSLSLSVRQFLAGVMNGNTSSPQTPSLQPSDFSFESSQSYVLPFAGRSFLLIVGATTGHLILGCYRSFLASLLFAPYLSRATII